MISWLAKQLLAYNMKRLNAGDPEPTLRLDTDDVRFRFPGSSSFSGEFHGKPALRAWLQRFCRIGIQISADEVAVTGFPWKQTVCVRGTDRYRSPRGEPVYENRYVIWGHMRWGRLYEYEVYEDTHAPVAFDQYLAAAEPAHAGPAAVAAPAS
jgi:ketosteroid isomerase-like protein